MSDRTLFDQDPPIRVEDFTPLAKLVSAYELVPGRDYLIIADGKTFSYDLAHALFAKLREQHPELSIFVVGTLYPKGLEVSEKKEPPDAPAT